MESAPTKENSVENALSTRFLSYENEDGGDIKPRFINDIFAQYKMILANKNYENIVSGEIAKYKAFVERILPKKIDPITAVTGETVEYIHSRFDDGNALIFSTETLLLPNIQIQVPGHPESKTITDGVEILNNHGLDLGIMMPGKLPVVSIETGDDKPSKDSFFGFIGVLEHRTTGNIAYNQGIFILDKGTLDFLHNQKSGKRILESLSIITTLFNHDFTAHGSFLPNDSENIDEKIGGAYPQGELGKLFSDLHTVSENRSRTGLESGLELWSLNLHAALTKNATEQRPAIKRWLRLEFFKYIQMVKEVLKDMPDENERVATEKYLIKTYAFCFFRLMSPQEFETSDDFKELREKYPDLHETDQFETALREKYIFGQEGMPTYDDTGPFVPHREIFDHIRKGREKLEDVQGDNNSGE